MEDNTETGAEAGGESYIAQLEAEQNAAEAADSPEPQEAPSEGGEETPPVEADKPTEPEKEPLSTEEYQKRHDNINTALKQERAEKRQMRGELDQLRAEIAEMRQSQPQQFQQFNLEQKIADYQTYDWQRYQQIDPDAANAAWSDYQNALSVKAQVEQQALAAAEQRQQQAQQAQFKAFAEAVNQSEDAYRQTRPDYDAAVAHLKTVYGTEANGLGFFGEDAERYAFNQVAQVMHRVHQAGQDVAEFAYNQAIARGYRQPVADIASVKAGAEAAKSISTLGTQSGAESGASFEETMSGLSGAAARSFWDKAKAQRYA